MNLSGKEYDADNLVTSGAGWNYKAPESGLYRITGYITTTSITWTSGNSYGLGVSINSSTPTYMLGYTWIDGTYTNWGTSYGTTTFRANKNDLIALQFIQWRNSGTLVIDNPYNTSQNYVTIERVGD